MALLRSRFCRTWDFKSEKDFQEDLQRAAELPNDLLSEMSSYAAQVAAAPSRRERRSAEEKICLALNRSSNEVLPILRVGAFLLRQFRPKGMASEDKAEDIANDLNNLGLIPKDRVPGFAAFFQGLKDSYEKWFREVFLKEQAASGVMPFLSGMGSTVDFRAVFDDSFGVESKLETYDPTCVGVVAVGIVNLRFDQGHVAEASFQVDERALNLLIQHLQALQKEIGIAQKVLGLENRDAKRTQDS